MNREDRAKQFMPFDALKGLKQALLIKEYENERTYKGDLSEEKMTEISQNLLNFNKKKQYFVKFFKDGHYLVECGQVVIEYDMRAIHINNTIVCFDDIFEFYPLDAK